MTVCSPCGRVLRWLSAVKAGRCWRTDREPASLRTGRVLTASSHRKCGNQGKQTIKARLRGLLQPWEAGAPDRKMRPTVRLILCPDLGQFFEMEVMSVKKLLIIIPSVLLLAAAGLLLLCKRHANQTGLACLDSDL